MTKDKSNRINRRNLLKADQMAPSSQNPARVCDLRKTREQAGKEAAYPLSPPSAVLDNYALIPPHDVDIWLLSVPAPNGLQHIDFLELFNTAPPKDSPLNKGRPVVNPDAPKSTSAAELLNRGNQLVIELDRQHKRLHDAVKGALKPDPQAWRSVRAAKTDYDAAYHELISLSKRLNQLIQNESPELIRSPTSSATANFGDVVTTKAERRNSGSQ
jgi:hypothetical protein